MLCTHKLATRKTSLMLITWPISVSELLWVNNLIAIAIVVVVALILRWIFMGITAVTVRRLVVNVRKQNEKLVLKGKKLALAQARAEQRTKTMGSVLRNIVTWIVFIAAFITILQIIGVSVVAIVASAGVSAAVIGFGAQNVVKDILNGMFIVFEDQYGVGDVIDTGLASGTVVDVGIRITTLKDDEGVIWFVRNGEITRVGNKSYKLPSK